RLEHALAARPLVNRSDERPVDLDFVGGYVGQCRERRIAGAEIVDGYPRADLSQHRNEALLELAAGEESVLGDLDHEAVGVTGRLQFLAKAVHEFRVTGALCRDIDADRRVRTEGV